MVPEVSEEVKDFSEYYHYSIAQSLDRVQTAWEVIDEKPEYLIMINNLLHQIFKKIHGRLSPEERKKQFDFSSRLAKLSPVKRERKMNKESGNVYVATIRTKHFPIYRSIVEKREIEMWDVLNKLSMTSKQREIRKQLM